MNETEQPKVEREDIQMVCIERDCNQDFLFKVGEQEFYERQGLYPPKRCPMCRLKRKQNAK